MFISMRITKRGLALAAALVVLCACAAGTAAALRGADSVPAAADAAQVPKTVYLTFDDGPSKNTDALLDLLDEEGVKATFFVTGQDEAHFDCIARADAAGHLIALHTYTHDFDEIYASDEAFWQDIDRLDALVFAQTGKHSGYLRFPGGSSNSVSKRYGGSEIMKTLTAQCAQRGIVYIDWNVDTKDAEGGAKSADYIVERALRGAEDVSGDLVILMHDGTANKTVTDAVRALIEQFREQGCIFDTLDHLAEPVHHHLS